MSRYSDNHNISEAEVDNVIASITRRIRAHQNISRGVSVRGAIAFKEVLQGFKEIAGRLTKGDIEKAALITLAPRIYTRQGDYETRVSLISETVREVLYGSQMPKTKTEKVSSDNTCLISIDNSTISLRDINLSLGSQKQDIELSSKDRIVAMLDKGEFRERLNNITTDNFREDSVGEWGSSSQEAIENLIGELELKFKQNKITDSDYHREKVKFEEILNAISQVRSQMSDKELAETMLEFMDAQDKQWQDALSFQDLFMYYHMKEAGQGKHSILPKQGWYGLRVIIDYLERQGLVRTVKVGESYILTAFALNKLIQYLIPESRGYGGPKGIIDYINKQISERSEGVRRYTIGSAHRDISFRHTLREIARRKKQLSDINRHDLIVFVRQKRQLKSDIVLCIDSSRSMQSYHKLTHARLVTAGLARTAIEKGDFVGVVNFNDLAKEIVPLTNRKEYIYNYTTRITAGGNTNISDGIKCAVQLLTRESNMNQKFIILITDGQPTAISEAAYTHLKPLRVADPSKESVIIEAKRASSKGIKISVVHITNGKDGNSGFIQTISDIGKGRVYRVNSLQDIKAVIG